jgi:glycosyltransferase involved in cell wall biosynthesis
LILSYSPVKKDPRVLRQINWIASASVPKPEISVYGLGEYSDFSYGVYTTLKRESVLARLISYVVFTHNQRQNLALRTFRDSDESHKIASGYYDLIILNDLDFVGYDPIFYGAKKSNTQIYLDLHEFFYDFGGSFVFRALNSSYYKWLLGKLKSRPIKTYFTVSEAIADLYVNFLPSRPVSVMNVPDVQPDDQDRANHRLDNAKTKLVYHGAAGKGRGVTRLIRAMKHVNQDFELNLVIVGSLTQRVKYMAYAHFLGVKERVLFHRPVEFTEIPDMLKGFDIQIIFYHPPHSANEKFSLPNKFFESARAGLALIIGDSPSMRMLVEKYQTGWVVEGWSHKHLAKVINSVSRLDILEKKRNSLLLSREISPDSQKHVFLHALEML